MLLLFCLFIAIKSLYAFNIRGFKNKFPQFSTLPIGFEIPEQFLVKSEIEASGIQEVDYVIVGSGIGGLSAAAMLSYYGYSVIVLESHYLPGGCAHSFLRNGFVFDAGPSLWNGMNTRPYNPLREILEVIAYQSLRVSFELRYWN